MKFCYYCGMKLQDDDVFCCSCGKRVVSSVASERHDKSNTKNDADSGARKPANKKKPLTNKIYVSGDFHTSIFSNDRDFVFTEGNGEILYTAKSKREDSSGGFFGSPDYTRRFYKISNGHGRYVGEVEFYDTTSEDGLSEHEITFHRPLPPKPPAEGFFQKVCRAMEPDETVDRFETPSGATTLRGFLAMRDVKRAGSYEAVSQGKALSFVPVRTDVLYKRQRVAFIESDDNGYRIEYLVPEHVLGTVMIFLALYVSL